MHTRPVTDDSSSQPAVPCAPIQTRHWSVGTLIYTRPQLVALFCWLLWGDFAWSMKDRSISPVAQIVIKKFGATDVLMSLFLVALPAAVGIVLGPVISFRSDRHRSRWGRRIPFIALTTPFAVAAMIGLGFSSGIGNALHSAFAPAHVSQGQISLILFGLFWALFEIATVAANAVFGALINDVVPHEFLGRFYGLFRALSLIAGMLFNMKLLKLAQTHYATMFLAVGLFYGLGCALMCVMVKEGRYPPPDDIAPGDYPDPIAAARLYLKECFTHPFWLWVIASMVVAGLVFMPVNLYSLPFAQSLHISMDRYGKYLALTYLISLCMAYPLGIMADRFHPLRVGIAAMASYAVITLWGEFYAGDAANYGIALVIHGVLSGIYFTATASLGQRLFPRMRFAQFASAAGLIGAVSNMVVAPATGALLDATRHCYRYTYGIGFALSLIATVLLLIVNDRFVRLGGPAAYQPPD